MGGADDLEMQARGRVDAQAQAQGCVQAWDGVSFGSTRSKGRQGCYLPANVTGGRSTRGVGWGGGGAGQQGLGRPAAAGKARSGEQSVARRSKRSGGRGVGFQADAAASLPQLLTKVLCILLGAAGDDGHAQGARLQREKRGRQCTRGRDAREREGSSNGCAAAVDCLLRARASVQLRAACAGSAPRAQLTHTDRVVAVCCVTFVGSGDDGYDRQHNPLLCVLLTAGVGGGHGRGQRRGGHRHAAPPLHG